MESMNVRFLSMMILMGVLLATTLISPTDSAPSSYDIYERLPLSDRPQVLVLVDRRIPELEKELFDVDPYSGASGPRTKRIGSLSIVNSLDVLRQRVLLELARRKALQDQRQIDANRRYLDTIGKRSTSSKFDDTSAPEIPEPGAVDFAIRHTATENGIPDARTQAWLEDTAPIFREQQDRPHKIRNNELRLF